MNIAQLLRTWRVVREKSQKEVAIKIGVKPRIIVRLEVGKTIDSTSMLKLINWLFSEAKKEKVSA